MNRRLSLCLLVLPFLLGVAANTPAATLTVGTVSANCGSQVSVPITIDSASGLLAAQFKVSYDTTRLTPANPAAAAGTLTAGFSISSNASGGGVTVALASGTPVSGSGTIAVLTFTVASNAPSGSTALTISQALVNDNSVGTGNGAVNVSCGGGGGSGATLTVGTVSANCGSQVSVPITIDSASGLLAAQFKVSYDTARLTPANSAAAAGTLTAGFSISSNASGGGVTVALASGTPVSGSGTIAVLTFAVASNAPSGSTALTISQALVNDNSAGTGNGAVNISCGGSGGAEMRLAQERVGVTLTWRNQYSGQTGTGTPVKQMDQYGYFWFDSAGNPEVFVKVLDFGGDSFLVFHSALSDLEYTVTFKVLRTGQTYAFRRDAGSVCGLADGTTVKK